MLKQTVTVFFLVDRVRICSVGIWCSSVFTNEMRFFRRFFKKKIILFRQNNLDAGCRYWMLWFVFYPCI